LNIISQPFFVTKVPNRSKFAELKIYQADILDWSLDLKRTEAKKLCQMGTPKKLFLLWRIPISRIYNFDSHFSQCIFGTGDMYVWCPVAGRKSCRCTPCASKRLLILTSFSQPPLLSSPF